MKNSVLIIGATSDVAREVALRYASEGKDLVLMGRNLPKIELLAEDIRIRCEVNVRSICIDVTEFDSHFQIINEISDLPLISIVFAGYLGDQQKAQQNWQESKQILDANLVGVISICNILSARYEQKTEGTLAVLSSVAGERGRQSNYIYGCAKAGLTAYLSGLRNRLVRSKVHVVTILPGFMDTKMTEELDLPGPLTASAQVAATKICRSVAKKKNVVYILWMWRYIMWIIRNIPERIFKKLSL